MPKKNSTEGYNNTDSEGLATSTDTTDVHDNNCDELKEFPAYIPTQRDLIQLVKYYATQIILVEWIWFVYWETGGVEMKLQDYYEQRIDEIAELIGEDAVNEAIEKAYEEYGRDIDPRLWEIFRNGTEEEKNAVGELNGLNEVRQSIISSLGLPKDIFQ